MKLFDLRPEHTVDREEPQQLLSRLLEVGELSSTDMRGLLHVLAHWAVRAIARTADIEGLVILDKLAALAIRSSRRSPDHADFSARLSTMRNLLEIRRLAINARGSTKAEHLLHSKPILDALAKGELPQSALRETLKLSPGRVSQLLNVMEEAGLVQRKKSGKENLVRRIDVGKSEQAPTGRATAERLGVPSFVGLVFGGAPQMAA